MVKDREAKEDFAGVRTMFYLQLHPMYTLLVSPQSI